MTQNYLRASALIFCGLIISGITAAQDNFRYWYSDIINGGSASNIYEVQLVDGEAHLTQIANLDYGAHISFADEGDQLYLVNDDNGEYQTLDALNPPAGVQPITGLDNPVSAMTVTTVSNDNKVLVGSGNTGKIYKLNGNQLTNYNSGNDISGGDIFYLGTQLYLASKPQGKFYKVNASGSNDLKGYVKEEVTGAANGEDNTTFLVSSRNSDSFVQYGLDAAGNAVELGEFPAMVTGGETLTPLTLENGDMASGFKGPELTESNCPNFKTYYASHGGGIDGTDLFSVDFENGEANLSLVAQLDYKTHIAIDAVNRELFTVNENGNNFQVWDANTGEEIRSVTIEGSLNHVTAAVFNPADNMIYVGSDSANEIFTIDPITGDISLAYTDIPVHGGDLVLIKGDLYLTSRNGQSTIYKINGSNDVTVMGSIAPRVNGSSVQDDGSILSAHKNTSAFMVTDGSGNSMGNIPVFYNNESYELINGDLASGCMGGEPGEQECNYQLFYVHSPSNGQRALYGVTLNADGTTSLEMETALDEIVHIGITSDGLIYSVKAASGKFRVFDPQSDAYIEGPTQITSGGDEITNIPAVLIASDGTFYVGSSSEDAVYTIDPNTGEATFFANGDVNGGDLIETNDGTIWLINRQHNEFINLSGGDNFTVDVDEINGAAVLDNGLILVADGNGESLLKAIDPATGQVTGTFDTGLALYNGDLAGGCTSATPDPDIVPGDCYAVEVVDYVEGAQMNGSDLQDSRNEPGKALGAPQDDDTENFVSLGYGGSLTLDFGGAVINEAGADIQIVETSFGDPDCDSYHEVASVEVSHNGEDWIEAGSVCLDGSVDISDADASMDYITQVRIVNNNDESETFDGYDVDGVIALHNGCAEDGEGLNNDTGLEGQTHARKAAENPETVQVNVYPNPFVTGLKIDLGKNFDNVQYEVYDHTVRVDAGQLVKTGKGKYQIPNLSSRLSRSGVQTIVGQYIVRFTANGKVIGSKVIMDSHVK